MTTTSPPQLAGSIEPRRSGERRRRIGFAGMAWVSLSLSIAAAAPSPLYVLYQAEWGFASWLLGLAFSVYAFALLLALVTVGSLSDYLGRRPVLAGAALAQLTAMTLFLVAPNIGTVLAARTLQGFATGVATATVSAALTDLAPNRNRQLGAVIAGIAPLAGLSVGAISTGLIVHAAHTPIPIVFTALDVLFVIGLAVVVAAPESVQRRGGAWKSLVPRLRIPSAARTAFVASSFLNVAVWTTSGLCLGLVAVINRDVFDLHNGLANGGIIALVMGVSTATAIVTRHLDARSSGLIATTTLAAAAAGIGVGVVATNLVIYLVASVVAGIGVGTGFGGYIRLLTPTTGPEDRAELFTAMYVVSYLSFGLPVVAAGAFIDSVGPRPVITVFCALTAVSAALGNLMLKRFASRGSDR
ncbi:MFS transporter [Kribbella ginsengisoli]